MIELKGYNADKLTINLVWANIFGLIILIPITLVFGIPYYLIWGNKFIDGDLKSIFGDIFPNQLLIDFSLLGISFFAILIIGVVFHELLHGITWALYTKNGFKSIKFGVLWKMLTPYCHCKEPLTVQHFIYGTIMPAFILGLIPAITSIIIGNLGLLIFGIFFTMAASGDFLMINLLKSVNKDDLVQDHPTELGCYIYKKKNNE